MGTKLRIVLAVIYHSTRKSIQYKTDNKNEKLVGTSLFRLCSTFKNDLFILEFGVLRYLHSNVHC